MFPSVSQFIDYTQIISTPLKILDLIFYSLCQECWVLTLKTNIAHISQGKRLYINLLTKNFYECKVLLIFLLNSFCSQESSQSSISFGAIKALLAKITWKKDYFYHFCKNISTTTIEVLLYGFFLQRLITLFLQHLTEPLMFSTNDMKVTEWN